MKTKTTQPTIEEQVIKDFDEKFSEWDDMHQDYYIPNYIPSSTIKEFLIKALAKQKVADYEQVQWELTELLIKERETGGHIDLAKYIKRLNKLKATKGNR